MNTATKTIKVYDEIVDFIASGTTPQSLIDFQLSEAAQERLEDLIYNAKNNALTKDDKRELEHFLTIEHILTLAKAKAYKYIKTDAK
jgi:DNA-binding protein YbaB